MIKKVLSYFYILFCWLVIAPISILVPKKKGSIVVFGKMKGEIMDNTKYFFLHGVNSNKNVRFVTQDRSLLKKHPQLEKYILSFPTFQAIFSMLRASIIVVDYSHWSLFHPTYFFLSIRAKKVHLWHGLTFKPVELGLLNTKLEHFKARLFRHVVRYDLMVSTSEFWTEILYKKYFLTKTVENFGYPRNDVLFRTPDENDLITADREKLQTLTEIKANGGKVVIYSPTFRDNGSDAFSTETLAMEGFNAFLKKNNITLVLKFHHLNKHTYSDLSNILCYGKEFDIYPLLSLCDAMITDYSSIYIDYLIVDRPIIFFNYDYEEYLEKNRQLQSTFLKTIPGVIAQNQKELETALLDHLVLDKDPFANQRTELKGTSYQHFDGNSSERIYQYLEQWTK